MPLTTRYTVLHKGDPYEIPETAQILHIESREGVHDQFLRIWWADSDDR